MTVLDSLCAENLTCVRGGRQVFRNIGFRVERGAALSLEGPNGSGKTSLLRLIAGLLPAVAGQVSVRTNGAQVRDAEERGKLIAWLGHQDGIRPQLSPRETLTFFARFYGFTSGISGMVDTAAGIAGLARFADVPCQYLSAGQRKRLSLARLRLSARPLWLLDEPFASLDVSGRSLARELIAGHCGSGGIAIVATHEPLGIEAAQLVLA